LTVLKEMNPCITQEDGYTGVDLRKIKLETNIFYELPNKPDEEVKEMTQTTEEKLILKKLRELSPKRRKELLDFIEFLKQSEEKRKWIEFDEWAMNLAKIKGFSYLTEEDVAKIVESHRKAE